VRLTCVVLALAAGASDAKLSACRDAADRVPADASL
jgi:hypothetical protein